jgi:dihydrofolate synthase/folylpolyglutamate synthase
MSYSAAIDHLSALVPELAPNPGQPRRKFSLDEIGALCAALGDPQKTFPSVLIAGTNGKGSTASTLAAIARESGLRVGLYTSPHLDRVNERIRIGEPGVGGGIHEIGDEDFARVYFHVDDTARRLVVEGRLAHYPSYFELLTAVAFVYFAEATPGSAPVDLAVLEVGIGGRLDATNIVSPLLSVITDISLDHQEWLGSTIALITREKAGILRPNGTLVTLPQHPEANQTLGEIATELSVRGINAAVYTPPIGTGATAPYPLEVLGREILVDSPLKGAHQHRNIALAIAAAVELAQIQGETRRFPITAEAIERGIHATSWPGRLEPVAIPGYPEIVLDVAHNPAGAWALRAALNSPGAGSPQVLIFGCLRDKPLAEMTQILFPTFDHIILAPIHSPRATAVEDLASAAEAVGTPHTVTASVPEAVEAALRLQPARIVISGSVYLVGEARHYLLLLAAEITQAGLATSGVASAGKR